MGAYLPWITAIVAIAMMVILALDYMEKRKLSKKLSAPCSCKDAVNGGIIPPINNNSLPVADSSFTAIDLQAAMM